MERSMRAPARRYRFVACALLLLGRVMSVARRDSLAVIPALLILLAAPFARADDEHKIEKIDKIEVTGHYENSVGSSDAASQGTVTAKLIENRPALRAGEVLEFVPGVIVTQHSGDGKANQYFLRGFNLDHGTDFATFVAGMPVNMRTHAHGQGYTDLNFLIPELIERIDYKKGPYYAEDGDFASAGSAHIHLANSLKQGVASLTLGENGYQRGALASSIGMGDGTLLYGVELAHNDGPWVNRENFRKASGVLRYSVGPLDNGYSVTAMAYSAKWHSTDQIPQRAVDSGLLDRFAAIDSTDGGESSRYSLSFDWKRRTDNRVFQLNAYAVQSRLNLFSNFTFFQEHPVDLGDPINGDQFEQSEARRMLGLNASQTWFGKLGGIETENKLGLQLRYDRLDPVALYSTVGQERVATIRSDNVKESSAGVYFENTLHWTQWLRSVAGVRFDTYRFDVASNVAENSGKVNGRIASPKLSLILGPWAKTEYFLNAGYGFHSNDARGTTTTLDPKTLVPADKVSPLVRSKGAEVGLRTELIPRLQSSLALWRLKLDSELLFVGDAGTTEASRPSLRQGIEWNNHYIAAPWLLFDLDLAASRSHFSDDDPAGSHIPGAVDKVASFGVSIDDLGPWFGAVQLRYFGPRPLIEDNSQRSGSTTLAYLRAGYKLARNWKVAVDVFNLFDRKASDIDYFYASRLKGEPAAGVNDIHFHPVEPRSFRISLSSHF
jgi:outer membrane receptor protein involved in Fe transport